MDLLLFSRPPILGQKPSNLTGYTKDWWTAVQEQIRGDLPTVPAGDRAYLRELLDLAESVRSTGVVFKNLKSGELATKRLDLLPEGITRGGMS